MGEHWEDVVRRAKAANKTSVTIWGQLSDELKSDIKTQGYKVYRNGFIFTVSW